MTTKCQDAFSITQKLLRRKQYKYDPQTKDGLKECLSTLDMISIGLGGCWGAGLYVIIGHVASTQAGPATFIAIIMAAAVSSLSATCYCEFGERVPRCTGSAYSYSYHTIGEFPAFVVGWTMLLEYMIGASVNSVAIARGIDALTGDRVSAYLTNHTFAVLDNPYPDVLAFTITLVFTIMVALGVQVSSRTNNLMNGVNVLVVIFIVVCGSFYADTRHWTDGPFLPYGTYGLLSGTASSFYAFIGFDVIATTGGEAKEPAKTIPRAIIGCMLVCLVAYISCSVILTLLLPFNEIQGRAALIDMFRLRHLPVAAYVVTVGSLCALVVDIMSAIFPMPRVIHAMAKDGLVFGFLGSINNMTQTPLLATLVTGLLSGIIAMVVGLSSLVEMMSVGTLMAYTFVDICVIVLRYRPGQHYVGRDHENHENHESNYGSLRMDTNNQNIAIKIGSCKETESEMSENHPEVTNELVTDKTSRKANWFLCIFVAQCFCLSALLRVLATTEQRGIKIALIVIASLVSVTMTMVLWLLWRLPRTSVELKFRVPLVPLIPCAAIFLNVLLVSMLHPLTWLRVLVWMAIGVIVYAVYGFRTADQLFENERKTLLEPSSVDCAEQKVKL